MTPENVREMEFRDLIAERGKRLLSCAKYLSPLKPSLEILTRPLLADMLSQSAQVEELIDSYCAGLNCQWCGFRLSIAAIKGFSDVSYELKHILMLLPHYHLLPINRDFVKDTNEILLYTSEVLIEASKRLLTKAGQIEIPFVTEDIDEKVFREFLPHCSVEPSCEARKIEVVSETVTMLATAFLNLAAESSDVCSASRAKPEEYSRYLTTAITEEKLRTLQLKFHNLQSLYDTYVSGTEAAAVDKDLPVLRGHISIVMHLLRVATLFTHHYERHINKWPCTSPARLKPVVNRDKLISVLMEYAVSYINIYIDCAVHLCHEMLKRYAEVGQTELPIPQYRGFHVRPSTLIAKLVQHYGSEVRMHLNNEVYDARLPFDLFRANEKINAQKRRWLTKEIVNLQLVEQYTEQTEIKAVVLGVVLTLAGRAKIIMYEQPLQLPDEPARKEGTVLEKVIDEINRLLMMGKIDVDIHISAFFIGDKRVLNDIKLLAEAGYGEDKFGNNVPLPKKLVYLRQK